MGGSSSKSIDENNSNIIKTKLDKLLENINTNIKSYNVDSLKLINDLEDLKEKKSTLKTELLINKKQLETLERINKISKITYTSKKDGSKFVETDIKPQEDKIKKLESNIETLESNIETLESNIKTLESNIKTLSSSEICKKYLSLK
jgi:chaperonin cofactor prefoldin